MKLYKKPNSPYWWADIHIDGQRTRFSTKRKVKSEAAQVANHRYTKELNYAQLGTRESVTLLEAFDRWLGIMKHSNDYRNLLRHRDKLFGLDEQWSRIWHLRRQFPLNRLDEGVLSKLREARRAEGLSDSSINMELKSLQRVYNLARLEWKYAVAPDVQFKFTKYKPKTRALTSDEQHRLLAELDPHRRVRGVSDDSDSPMRRKMQDLYDLTIFLMDTGCRLSEASSVPWSVVSMNRRVINLYRSKVDNESNLVMTNRLFEVMQRRYAERGGNTYVFAKWSNSHLEDPKASRSVSTRGLRAAIKRAGLNEDEQIVKTRGKVTPHTLRDTFATRLAERGMPMDHIMKLLGHTTTAMTMKYVHLDTESVSRAAADLLE